MATVMTVLGPVDASDLGRVLVHEHVRISYPGDELDPNGTWDRAACIATAVERMEQLLEHGVKTFVDPCPIDLGRDPELLAEVAQRSGMHIVCSTGFYHEHNAIGIPYYWRVRSAEEVAEFYLHEITNGIGSTGIRPGVIKVASGDPPGEHDRKVIAAAGIAQRESGLPIVTHCENSKGGDTQQAIIAEQGADLGRCMIGHQDQEPDAANLAAIIARGSFVGIDRVGLLILAPEEQRADNIAALVREGHAERVCLSQDHMCCLRSPKFPYALPPEIQEIFETQLKPVVYEQMVNRPHTYLITDFLPLLRARGVDDKTIETILTDNPRRLLAGV
jgi:phosphotriesterase-related protein